MSDTKCLIPDLFAFLETIRSKLDFCLTGCSSKLLVFRIVPTTELDITRVVILFWKKRSMKTSMYIICIDFYFNVADVSWHVVKITSSCKVLHYNYSCTYVTEPYNYAEWIYNILKLSYPTPETSIWTIHNYYFHIKNYSLIISQLSLQVTTLKITMSINLLRLTWQCEALWVWCASEADWER